MPVRPLVIALACIAAPSLALAAKWEKVGETGAVAVYADKESLRRNGSEVRSRLEWRWARPTDVPDGSGGRQYRLERQLQISNCENRSFAIAEGTLYADERGVDPVSSYKYEESTLPWSRPPARTIRETVVTYMCSAAPAKK